MKTASPKSDLSFEAPDRQAVTDALDQVVGEMGVGKDPVVAAANRRTLLSTDWDEVAVTAESEDDRGL